MLMLRAAMKPSRTTLFSRCRSPEALPPTSDTARLHIRRARFQAMIWKQAHVTNPTLPLPETMGWSRLNDKLVPKLMSQPPMSESCDELVNCGCKSGCTTMKCICRCLPTRACATAFVENERNCTLQLFFFFLAAKSYVNRLLLPT